MKYHDNSSSSSSTSSGITIAGLLGVAFVILRLCNVINWPWLWVLSPFWIPAAIAIVIFLIVILWARH